MTLPIQQSSNPWPGRVATLALIALACAAAVASYDVVAALLVPTPRTANVRPEGDLAKPQISSYVAQVNGRTPFYTPDRPPPPAPPPVERDNSDPPPPPPPATYGGPKIMATINDTVWFDNGKRVAVGDEQGGVKVLEIRAPWEVIVLWKDVEFKVPLFERDSLIYPAEKGRESLSEQPPPAPTPEPESGTPTSGPDQSTATNPHERDETETSQ